MSRYKLRHPDQPFVVRFLLGCFEFFSSLLLAVGLILSCAVVLGWGTFVESRYGTPAVQFGVYGTAWFSLLNLLLAVNIFCAAAIRYPWKRHQTGFVITHIGLLVLLFGCWLQRRGGIDAQMPVLEGSFNHVAYEDQQRFMIQIEELTGHGSESAATQSGPRSSTIIEVPFVAGPFNWDDFDRDSWLPNMSDGKLYWFPWLLARRDQGVLFDEDGVTLDVQDFYSDSVEIDVPLLELELKMPQMADNPMADDSWQAVPLSVQKLDPDLRRSLDAREKLINPELGLGVEQKVGGGSVMFWLVQDGKDVKSFLDRPDVKELGLGTQGQVVLRHGNEVIRFRVEDQLGQGRFPLGDSGVEVEVTSYLPAAAPGPDGKYVDGSIDGKVERPGVVLNIFEGDRQEEMVLIADLPWLVLNSSPKVRGSYWFDHGEKTGAELMAGKGGSRIDIVQTTDGKLFYRYWNRKDIVAAGPLDVEGDPIDAFKMPRFAEPIKLRVKRHVASSHPKRIIDPLPFDKDRVLAAGIRAAKVKLTIDGESKEFWIQGSGAREDMMAQLNTREDSQQEREPVLNAAQRKTLRFGDKLVTITLPTDRVDLGFNVRLLDFQRRLDPGTSQPSHYGSTVDFCDRADPSRNLEPNVEISMNAPVDFSNPAGRSYRLFQESFREVDRDQFVSFLTVNYDPGRAIKYLGSLLVVAGIATMFYMRAYFFKQPSSKQPRSQQSGSKQSSRQEPQPPDPKQTAATPLRQ